MTKKQYENTIAFWKANTLRKGFIVFCAKVLPVVVSLIFVVMAISLMVQKDSRVISFILVPAFTFLSTTILRKLIDRPRPYDTLGYTPLLNYKENKGQSCPSRHTVSAFIIAIACLYISLPLGIICLIFAGAIAFSRVATGMHYIFDVTSAIIISCICGIFAFWIFK